MQDEKRIANEIMMVVRRLQLPLKLDEITEGRGNCFPLAILAQCRRIEIFRGLRSLTQSLIQQNNPTLLRRAVYTFMTKSRHITIQNYKKRYQEILARIDDKTWEEYWDVMIRNYEWVDYIFIQSAAWYLGQDIIIVTTTSTEQSPFITISGNMSDENIPCPGIPLTIGSKSSVHYQSLLPLEIRVIKTQIKPGLPENTINLAATKVMDHSDLNTNSREGLPDLTPTKGKRKDQPEATSSRRTMQNNFRPTDFNSGNEQQNDHPELDINSRDEFPDLGPSKRKRKVQSEASSSRKVMQRNARSSDINPNNYKHPAQEVNLNKNSDKPEEQNQTRIFKYKLDGKILNFLFVSDKRVNCPTCRNDFKNILRHLQQSGCKIPNMDDLSNSFKQFTNDQNKRKAKSIAKQRAADNQKVKQSQNERNAKFIAKQREVDF